MCMGVANGKKGKKSSGTLPLNLEKVSPDMTVHLRD